ncbi:TPA: cytochrome P450 [Escherichia coli]|uniref:CYP736A167 n=1 Tax=Santalum album TaxID=35974 RepID=A0A142I6X1_SANAL|nr:CYP736A167 [Santalum album]UGC41728.1 santalene/bergamotene oxidase [synthetic construct]HDB9652920.1 cytochrome P450 [Escherichia coli]HDB9968341.1 cytochrome P450 [Escherichia coli]HDC0020733.1 cytochrome P450 [Escherichia coli]
MSPATAVILTLLVALGLSILLRRRQKRNNLPPGPPALPIIGNIHILGTLPHQSLYNLAKKYGPIMSMRLGLVPAVVISSPEAAELVLKTHDIVFASRPRLQVADYFHYGTKGVILTEYGTYWRNMRRLCTVKLLNTVKIDSFAGTRKKEVASFVQSLKEASVAHKMVNLSARVANVIENMVCLMVIGRSSDERFKLKEVIQEAAQLAGAFNIGDYVPFLMPLDLQGLTRRIKSGSKAFDDILEVIIDEHVQDIKDHDDEQHGDFIDVLLAMMNKPMDSREGLSIIDRTNIKAILVDMIGAAMDTSTSGVEWAISELIKHPRVMKKLQDEVKTVIGMNRMVEEADLPKLPYLDMVVKETMRLHPPGPLLVPRESMEDITINGYYIPKKSRIIVNAWAIGRDTNAWSNNAHEFFPERFMSSNVDLQGQDFQLIPFGSGRRGCPGMRLGLTTVRLVLAQLIHCFDLELPKGTVATDLDMSEKFGLAMPRAQHLLAFPTYRLES